MGALILAINPGNSHSPTLARLARELQGCELIGADSCAVAITAINKRVPDLVLLPDRTPRGETDLLARLRAVPGGVMTLKLPPVPAADPTALAKEIRTLLAEAAQPAPVRKASGPSPHLVAAAQAMFAWMDARRAQWADAERAALQEPVPAFASGGTFEPHERFEPHEPADPFEHPDFLEPVEHRTPWLPRAAVAAGLAGAVAAGVWFWPHMNDTLNAAPTETAAQPASAPADTVAPSATPEPLAASPETAPAQAPPDKPAAAPVALAEPVAGFVAVFAPFDISISNANQPVALDDQGRAMLPSGKYRLRFQNRELGYDETRSVQVRPTETTTINLIPQTTISVTSNEPGEVLIDGQRAGETPFEGRAPYGAHTITVRTAGGERQFQLAATMKPVQLEADFTKP